MFAQIYRNIVLKNPKYQFNFDCLKIMIKCRFFYMRIILLSFLLLSNFSTHLISCPSSGDGDCVPSTDTSYTYNQLVSEEPGINTSSTELIIYVKEGDVVKFNATGSVTSGHPFKMSTVQNATSSDSGELLGIIAF